jgi:hypothetical protein
MKKKFLPLAALAMLSLPGTGCGSDARSETGTAAGSGTARSEKGTNRDAALKFAECVRSNGVPDFPDPNPKGQFAYGVSVSPEVWTRAVGACKGLQPPGSLSYKRSPRQQSATLRFARCVRGNGVKDFPDPTDGEPLVDTTRIPSTDREGGMTILNAAMQKCRSVMAEAAAGR